MGILMERRKLSAEAAFAVLVQASQEANTRLREVALRWPRPANHPAAGHTGRNARVRPQRRPYPHSPVRCWLNASAGRYPLGSSAPTYAASTSQSSDPAEQAARCSKLRQSRESRSSDRYVGCGWESSGMRGRKRLSSWVAGWGEVFQTAWWWLVVDRPKRWLARRRRPRMAGWGTVLRAAWWWLVVDGPKRWLVRRRRS